VSGDLESRMNMLLERLGVCLRCVYAPDPDAQKHAIIDPKEGLIVIHSENEDEAWGSLIHEIVEWRLRPVLKVYRELVNNSISIVEKLAYDRKEEAIDRLVRDFSLCGEVLGWTRPCRTKAEK